VIFRAGRSIDWKARLASTGFAWPSPLSFEAFPETFPTTDQGNDDKGAYLPHKAHNTELQGSCD
jgi:hypothetical protein